LLNTEFRKSARQSSCSPPWILLSLEPFDIVARELEIIKRHVADKSERIRQYLRACRRRGKREQILVRLNLYFLWYGSNTPQEV